MLKIGLIVFTIVAVLAGTGVGIGIHVQKGKEKDEAFNKAIKEKFNQGYRW